MFELHLKKCEFRFNNKKNNLKISSLTNQNSFYFLKYF